MLIPKYGNSTAENDSLKIYKPVINALQKKKWKIAIYHAKDCLDISDISHETAGIQRSSPEAPGTEASGALTQFLRTCHFCQHLEWSHGIFRLPLSLGSW